MKALYSQVYCFFCFFACCCQQDCRTAERERVGQWRSELCVHIFGNVLKPCTCLLLCWGHSKSKQTGPNQSRLICQTSSVSRTHFYYCKSHIMFQYWPKLTYHSAVLHPLQSCFNNLIQVVATCLIVWWFSLPVAEDSLLVTTGRMTSPLVCNSKTWDNRGVGLWMLVWPSGFVSLASVFWEENKTW